MTVLAATVYKVAARAMLSVDGMAQVEAASVCFLAINFLFSLV